MLHRHALMIAASTLTASGVSVAIMAGLELGSSTPDKLVYIGIAVSASLITQFLPARKPGWGKWGLWLIAAFTTMLIDMAYFSSSGQTAGELRAAESVAVTDVTRHVTAVTAERDAIVSRSATTIAAELANEYSYRKRAALKIELAEANRKAKLSEQINALHKELVTTRNTNAATPIARLVTDALGISASAVSILYSFVFFILIEVSAAYLWLDLLNKNGSQHRLEKISIEPTSETCQEAYESTLLRGKNISVERCLSNLSMLESETGSDALGMESANSNAALSIAAISKNEQQLKKLNQDIREGKCDTTVRAIRQHLRCSTELAAELSRAVKSMA